MQITGLPRVLIIESQLIVAADIALQLTRWRYEVIGIGTQPEEALEYLTRHRPDIVILGGKVGSRAGGERLSALITQQMRIPLVMLSGSSDQRCWESIVAARPYAFIPKPFRREDLQRAMKLTVERMVAEGISLQLADEPQLVRRVSRA
ncbi:AmiR/NasT family two-component response regulator [Lewinella aquimaris]|uniref:AmiR/NasT family two-component response regulator n=1 Tax=Neolewinella aquimaris TaxID=1835722 RepID=A0A840E9A2_9BACT|nr:response regulator [Neolewinella aquimaris]MBB4080302.1 AmiR/NasT family two-component response regulator [Neolewinella aquimaris]